MKRKTNKKGFTLVEVIIAMSVFAIISTGFVMAASYAYKAQTKAKKRLTISNEQTTNLEDYRGVIDPTYAGTYDEAGISDLGVQRIGSDTGKWIMTYKFDNGTVITNNRMRGFSSTPAVDDKVFQLTYFSPNDRVSLDSGEYWVTIYNVSPDVATTLPMLVKCDGTYNLFNNEKKIFPGRTTMPSRIIPGDNYQISFGVKDTRGAYYNTGKCVSIYDSIDAELNGSASLPIYQIDLSDAQWSDHHVYINYDSGSFEVVPEE